MIRAVLFDVGGPLDLELRSEAAIDADIRDGLESVGIDVDDAAFAEAEREAVGAFAPSVYRAIIWHFCRPDAELCGRVYDWLEANAAERSFFDLRPGIGEVLTALKARGLKLGLAANQPAHALDALAEHGLSDLFDVHGISGVYGLRKPDVRLFVAVCADLGVEPAECIMVGDRIDNDIVPARWLGMRSVLIRSGRHRRQQPRDWTERPDAEVEDAAGILCAIEAILTAEAS